MSARVCEECGCDRWLVREAARTMERLRVKARHAEDLARQNGLLRYQLEIAEQERVDLQSHLQRKIVRQARAIRRFEQRLRDLGVRPWAGHSLEEVAPAAEHDAEQVLDGEARP